MNVYMWVSAAAFRCGYDRVDLLAWSSDAQQPALRHRQLVSRRPIVTPAVLINHLLRMFARPRKVGPCDKFCF